MMPYLTKKKRWPSTQILLFLGSKKEKDIPVLLEKACSVFVVSCNASNPDTVLKKYSSTVATIFASFASAALFGHTLTINFMHQSVQSNHRYSDNDLYA
ncbi:hypothetical protein QVD17_01042 [Tagetes erecta]|uniref:Uncharacterized protein n=1 Tax=Tagetes erecta TaxID=13708 RepID=A0AAD8L9X0_TARER|nr:hypothetical protein QVD17_01042 [Tagetes erecta]